MITLLIAVAAACGGFSVVYWPLDGGLGWSVFAGLVVFGVLQVASGVLIQKRVKADMARVQDILAAGQKRLQAKMLRWQMRPPGSVQAAQREMFEDTKVFVREALVATEALARYRHWVPMIDRQMATAQLQLNWMIKDFKAVDRLMPKALFFDPTLSAVKMARLYALNAPTEEIGKVYAKAVRRVKYNGNVLLAATWSWILVRRGETDAAFKALGEALKKSDDATLRSNHEHLMNNRVTHFSNSQIGDSWYSLYLEEPKIRTQRQHPVYR